eukprot:m.18641 g.18641  ORF g.18641 m.18641 type:complete len:451 (+) comp3613_c0_seq1:58-1410(+)
MALKHICPNQPTKRLVADAQLSDRGAIQRTRWVACGRRVAVVLTRAGRWAGGFHKASANVGNIHRTLACKPKGFARRSAQSLWHVLNTLLKARGGSGDLVVLTGFRIGLRHVRFGWWWDVWLLTVQEKFFKDKLAGRVAGKGEGVFPCRQRHLHRLSLVPPPHRVVDGQTDGRAAVDRHVQVLVHVERGKVGRQVVGARLLRSHLVCDGTRSRRIRVRQQLFALVKTDHRDKRGVVEGCSAQTSLGARRLVDHRGKGGGWNDNRSIAVGGNGCRRWQWCRKLGNESVNLVVGVSGNGPVHGNRLIGHNLGLVEHERRPQATLPVSRVVHLELGRPPRAHGGIAASNGHPSTAQDLLVLGPILTRLHLQVPVLTPAVAPPCPRPVRPQHDVPARRRPARHGCVTLFGRTPRRNTKPFPGESAPKRTPSTHITSHGNVRVVAVADPRPVRAV